MERKKKGKESVKKLEEGPHLIKTSRLKSISQTEGKRLGTEG